MYHQSNLPHFRPCQDSGHCASAALSACSSSTFCRRGRPHPCLLIKNERKEKKKKNSNKILLLPLQISWFVAWFATVVDESGTSSRNDQTSDDRGGGVLVWAMERLARMQRDSKVFQVPQSGGTGTSILVSVPSGAGTVESGYRWMISLVPDRLDQLRRMIHYVKHICCSKYGRPT